MCEILQWGNTVNFIAVAMRFTRYKYGQNLHPLESNSDDIQESSVLYQPNISDPPGDCNY